MEYIEGLVTAFGTPAIVIAIIAEKAARGLRLCAVSNITEGNFLGFEEDIPETAVVQKADYYTKEEVDTLLSNAKTDIVAATISIGKELV